MAKYRIVFDDSQSAVLSNLANDIGGYESRLKTIAGGMDTRDRSMATLQSQIRTTAAALPAVATRLRREGEAWRQSVAAYKNAETNAGRALDMEVQTAAGDLAAFVPANQTQWWDIINPVVGPFLGSVITSIAYPKAAWLNNDTFSPSVNPGNDAVTPMHSTSPAYSGNSYGGNQGSAVKNYMDFADIVRKYNPNLSDSEVNSFLTNMNKTGCAYVAMSNTLFAQYAGREKDFENTFGFPMYKEDGTINSDSLIVDYYCSTGTNRGISFVTQASTWEAYMEKNGISVKFDTSVKPTAQNYNELSKNGEIVLSMKPLCLRDVNGNMVDSRDAGHAVTITGYTEDGMLTVSSWGRQYFVDPAVDTRSITGYMQVIYE